jgi:purine-binding chemotaxis protein CheW
MEAAAQSSFSRFLTFRVDSQLYALRAEEVSEVIRVPTLARVPQGPAALLGVANLRGAVLPVAGLRELLGKPPAPALSSARAIVLDIGAAVALLVDSVETLETSSAGQIETHQHDLGADGAERLLGAFSFGPAKSVAKILDIKAMLQTAFANRNTTRPAHPCGHHVRGPRGRRRARHHFGAWHAVAVAFLARPAGPERRGCGE